MGQRQHGPLGQNLDPNYIDEGTLCRQRMFPPGPVGIAGVSVVPDYFCTAAAPEPVTVLATNSRIGAVRLALERSRPIFEAQFKAIFTGLDVAPLLEALWDTVKQAALILGGSTIAGAAVGFFFGGVGAVPGAAAGFSVGVVIMNLLGLGELIAEIPEKIEAIVGPYSNGFQLAWYAPDEPTREDEKVNEAATHFGAGHVVLALAVLAAIIAYATRGKGKKIKEVLERSRLKNVADWIEKNKTKLKEQIDTHTAREGPPMAGHGGSAPPPGHGGSAPQPPHGPSPRPVNRGRWRTQPSGTPGGRPTGRRTVNKRDADSVTKRSLELENESADRLAYAGYKVEQNPVVGGNRNPDYRIEGEIFDCYAPQSSNAKNLVDQINRKIGSSPADRQADRILLNLKDSAVTRHELREAVTQHASPDLKEIIMIDRTGNIVHFYP